MSRIASGPGGAATSTAVSRSARRPRFVVAARALRPWPFDPREGPSSLEEALEALTTRRAIAGVEVPPYLALAACGMATGFAVIVGLGLEKGVPVSLLAALSAAALFAYLGLTLLSQWITRRERHALLEGILCALLVVGLLAAWVGQPVLTVLDLFAVGLGTFLFFGRLGCLASGCCHGRPSAVGLRYGPPAHDALAGIRLFPVQLVEAIWLLAVTLVAGSLVAAVPGTALWFWLLGYAAGRFVLEFARGDRRARLGPLSEAQWLCLAILGARASLELADFGAGAWRSWALVGAAALAVVGSHATRRRWLALPHSPLPTGSMAAWQAFLDALERDARATPGAAELRRAAPSGSASVGLVVDAAGDGQQLHSYALRGEAAPLDEETALTLAGAIAQRLPAHQVVRAGFCETGAFHYWALVDPAGPPGSVAGDDPWLTRLRAQAFSSLVRSSARRSAEEPLRADPPLPSPPRSSEPARIGLEAWYFQPKG